MKKRELSIFDKNQLKVARKTLRMPDEIVNYLSLFSNCPGKEEAREIVKRLTGKR